jgi:hypothetical protein
MCGVPFCLSNVARSQIKQRATRTIAAPTMRMLPDTPPHAQADEPTQTRQWFDRGTSGRLRITSRAAREELETFAAAIRNALGGPAIEVKRWPYRYAGTTWWAFHAEGSDGSVSLAFVETGKTMLPVTSPIGGTGEVADAADAHYLLEFLERELSPSP